MFEKAISINPSEISSTLAIALIHLDHREPEKTIEILGNIHQNSLSDPRIYQIWSECLNDLGKNREARKLEEKARILELSQGLIKIEAFSTKIERN